MMRMPGLAMPVLGVLGLEAETMGWGTQPEDVLPWLPPGARFVPLEGVGHFVHIEQPRPGGVARARVPRRPAGGACRRLGRGRRRRRPARPAADRPAAPRAQPTAERTTFLTHHRASARAAPAPRRRCRRPPAAAAARPRRAHAGGRAAGRRGGGRARCTGSTSPATAPRRSRSAAATPPRSSWPTPTPRVRHLGRVHRARPGPRRLRRPAARRRPSRRRARRRARSTARA